ncbi:MAG: ORF6C domain-containing protein [Anaerolineales bacterium]|nr:ORF6C domain-containing protein [Anaerolineales bacterium]
MSDLVPVEQKTVLFYDDEITAVLMADSTVYVPVRPLCERLGVDWSAQYRRIQRDLVLNEVAKSVAITATDLPSSKTGPRTSELLAIPLDYLNGWLFGINASRVKEEIRATLVRYQRECYRVLYDAFQTGELSADFGQLLAQADPESRAAYHMALAVVKLARQQIVLQSEVADHGRRLDLLEARLGDEARTITEDQAAQISQAVKAVALTYGKQTSRNEFGAVYGEMYRKFEVTSYKLIPSAKFQAVMDWLTEWHQSLVDNTPF